LHNFSYNSIQMRFDGQIKPEKNNTTIELIFVTLQTAFL
jgi:hypothetical protein